MLKDNVVPKIDIIIANRNFMIHSTTAYAYPLFDH